MARTADTAMTDPDLTSYLRCTSSQPHNLRFYQHDRSQSLDYLLINLVAESGQHAKFTKPHLYDCFDLAPPAHEQVGFLHAHANL